MGSYQLPNIRHAIFTEKGTFIDRRIPRYDRYFGNYVSLKGVLYQVNYRSGYTVTLGNRIELKKKPDLFKR